MQAFFEPIRTATEAKGETDVEALAAKFAKLKQEFGVIQVPARAFLNVARRLAERKQTAAAIKAFAATAKRFPDDPMVYFMQGQYLEDRGRKEAAAAVYEAGAKRFAPGPRTRSGRVLRARLETVRASMNEKRKKPTNDR